MKILVPADFSKASNNAALYAAKFAQKAKAEIILLNVIHIASPPMVQITESIKAQIHSTRISETTQECVHLTNELKSQVRGVPISHTVIIGYPIEDEIEKYASSNKVDLIIMGTKGASGLQKILFGSNAERVINKSSIPVITVPQYSRFKNCNHIVYASDLHDLQSEIKKIIPIAKIFDSSIQILHILPADSTKKIDTAEITNDLIKSQKYQKIALNVIYTDNIIDGINERIADTQADILVMSTHEMGFFEKLYKTSLSKELAFHSLTPLLTLKKLV